jgi:hypothetical protein
LSFETEWARCGDWISAALEYTGEPPTHTLEDVRDEVLSGRFQFWPGARSAVVTEIAQYPRVKAVRIFLAGGDLSELQLIETEICDWAKHIECSRVEIAGRAGWQRALPGYVRASTWLAKDIRE